MLTSLLKEMFQMCQGKFLASSSIKLQKKKNQQHDFLLPPDLQYENNFKTPP